MLLYKFLPSREIAEQVSLGTFRFYELMKYIQMEDSEGRSDSDECSIAFPKHEWTSFPHKAPKGSFRGVEFSIASTRPSLDYIQQYFVFCTSTRKDAASIGDAKYAVELNSDIFDLFEIVLSEALQQEKSEDLKLFSHGNIVYYDIHNQPDYKGHKRWKDVYLKHKVFSYQCEYRASLFISGQFFDELSVEPLQIANELYDPNFKKMNFDLKIYLRAGVDSSGWRYIEIDTNEFSKNLCSEPSKIYPTEL